jgi:hypothetical protein
MREEIVHRETGLPSKEARADRLCASDSLSLCQDVDTIVRLKLDDHPAALLEAHGFAERRR